jgi:DHA1 family multidrug resistance protein-like MFS transporter
VSLKLSLVMMTVIAVVTDSMLHPFYPQYFAVVLAVTDPRHVGLYIAACSLTVMLSFPLWALLSRRFGVLELLVVTQVATAVLSIACTFIEGVVTFWIVSLAMMVWKASYLLIYPYLLSVEDESDHIGTISLLALVVYFGNILAALVSGAVFELSDPRLLFVAMAAGDGLQILLCLYMLRRHPAVREGRPPAEGAAAGAGLPTSFLLKLGLVMFLLYFSAYLTEPFFSVYWERAATSQNRLWSGLVFAIPGIAALFGLYLNARSRREGGVAGIVPSILIAVCGLALEATGRPTLVVAGRLVFGWALFQAMVRLDLVLFRASRPESYALDFSKINVSQALGVQAASLAAGSLVSSANGRLPFLAAGAGFVACAFLYVVLLRDGRRAEPAPAARDLWAPTTGES